MALEGGWRSQKIVNCQRVKFNWAERDVGLIRLSLFRPTDSEAAGEYKKSTERNCHVKNRWAGHQI